MILVIVLFLVLFLTLALLLLVVSGGGSSEDKQAQERLEAISSGPGSMTNDDEAFSVRREETLSGLLWLDRLLQTVDLGMRLRLLLYQADLAWTPGRLILTAAFLGLVGGYLVYLRTGGGLLALIFAGIFGSLPFLYVLRKRGRRFAGLKERLPEALDLMVSAIRAGHGFTSAMGMAARESQEPVKREFRKCFDEQNYGLDLRVAMKNLVHCAPIRDVRVVATAVLIQKETGGNLTEILEKVSQLIREDFRLQRQVRVHTAQGRMTGWILSLLPAILGVMLYFVNPEHMSVLWKRPVGVYLLEASVVMTLIGGLIIRKIIQIEV